MLQIKPVGSLTLRGIIPSCNNISSANSTFLRDGWSEIALTEHIQCRRTVCMPNQESRLLVLSSTISTNHVVRMMKLLVRFRSMDLRQICDLLFHV